jgi:DNA invertase Pin-like site-specific DNA recombinase
MSERGSALSPQSTWRRGEEMKAPDEVAAMLRLKRLGWGVKRIATELGCSHMTVRRYLEQGGWVRRPRRNRRKLPVRNVLFAGGCSHERTWLRFP